MVTKCLDCQREGITTNRKASGKPLLCATHRRARRYARRGDSWARRIADTYGLTEAEYWDLYGAQDGKCYICGTYRPSDHKKLSVDHCHKTGRIRGLLCQRCNRDVLGHFRDEIDAFRRGAEYLENPPAFAVIGQKVVPNHDTEA